MFKNIIDIIISFSEYMNCLTHVKYVKEIQNLSHQSSDTLLNLQAEAEFYEKFRFYWLVDRM